MKHLDDIGKTPLYQLKVKNINNCDFFCKDESQNPTGSIKDRAAQYILQRALEKNIINNDTTIVESSSGNFGVSLSAYCKYYNLNFTCVVDPHISPINEMLIRKSNAHIVKVDTLDVNGGYLLSRLEVVHKILHETQNSYWTNQYNNPYITQAYEVIFEELLQYLPKCDYIFVGVSSGGTITGISNYIIRNCLNTKVIAVDIEGSVIFGKKPKPRFIPGIGSSIIPANLKHAIIHDVIHVNEISTIEACHELLKENAIFAGGSSGSVYAAMKKYICDHSISNAIVVGIFPDRGERYYSTIYNSEWVKSKYDERIK